MKPKDMLHSVITSAENISSDLDESVLTGKGKYLNKTAKEIFDAQSIIVDIILGKMKSAIKKYHKSNDNTKSIFTLDIRDFMDKSKGKK